MHLTLDISTTPMGILHGTARRTPDDASLAFHGVLELVAVIDRLLAGATPSPDDADG